MTTTPRRFAAALTTLALLATSATALAARSASDIREGIRAQRPALKACYETALRSDPGLEGKLVVAFTIAEDGVVAAARAKASTLAAPAMEACVLDAFRDLRFAAAPGDGPTEVSYPLVFRAGQAIARAR